MNFITSKFLKTLVLILLSFCTIWLFNVYDRYVFVGQELLENAAFNNGLDHWTRSSKGISLSDESRAIVKLHASSPTDSIALSQEIHGPQHTKLLRLSCNIKTHNIIGGNAYWKAARVVFIQRNHQGKMMYSLPHLLAYPRGDNDWAHYDKVFAVDPDMAEMQVSAEIIQGTGTLWIKALSLRPIAVKTAFKQYRQGILYIWLAALLWVATPFIRSGFSDLKHAIVLIHAMGIIIGVLMPENLKEYLNTEPLSPAVTDFTAFIPTHFNDTDSFGLTPLLPSLDVYKAGHFIMFTLLAIAIFGARPYRATSTRLFGYLVLFALITEVLQLFMAGRTAQFGDVIIDSLGITLGISISMLWTKWKSDNPERT